MCFEHSSCFLVGSYLHAGFLKECANFRGEAAAGVIISSSRRIAFQEQNGRVVQRNYGKSRKYGVAVDVAAAQIEEPRDLI